MSSNGDISTQGVGGYYDVVAAERLLVQGDEVMKFTLVPSPEDGVERADQPLAIIAQFGDQLIVQVGAAPGWLPDAVEFEPEAVAS